jgi:hypothetical protein
MGMQDTDNKELMQCRVPGKHHQAYQCSQIDVNALKVERASIEIPLTPRLRALHYLFGDTGSRRVHA